MTLHVSLEQAAKNALKTYLASALAGVTVYDRWPGPDTKLGALAVSVIFAGDSEEDVYDPVLISATPLDATHVSAVYDVGSVRKPLQIDIWATNDPARDDLVARVDDALREGVGVTLSQGTSRGDPTRSGVLLPLGDGWTSNADFYFDRARRMDTPETVREREFRSMALGVASMMRTKTKTLPRASRLTLKVRVHDVGPCPAPTLLTGPSDDTQIAAGGITHFQG